MGITFDDLTGGVHISPVFDGVYLVFADAATGTEMVLEADFVFAVVHTPLGHIGVAGTNRVEFVYQLYHQVHRIAETIGPVVLPCAFHDMACLEDTRKLLLGNADTRITLAVLQQDVVMRLVFLDEVVLQEKSVLLAVHHHITYVGYVFDKLFGLEAVLLLMEITAHTTVEVLSLTYVYYFTFLVEVLVHTGLLRYALKNLSYVLVVARHVFCPKITSMM